MLALLAVVVGVRGASAQTAWTVWRVVLSAGLALGAAGYPSVSIGQVPRPGAAIEMAVDARFTGDQVEMPLKDLVWLTTVDGVGTGGEERRMRLARAASGLRLLNVWRA